MLIYSSLPRFPSECDQFVREGGHAHDQVAAQAEFDGRSWNVLVSLLEDVSGAEVGDLIILSDISETKAAFHRLLAVASGGAVVLLVVLLGFLYVALRRTDRSIRAQEADLQKSEAFQRALSEALPDFVFVLDDKGTIQRVNRVQPGQREEDVVGKNATMFMLPEYHDAYEKAFRQARETGRLQTIETMVDLPDGRHCFLNRLQSDSPCR